MTATKPIRFAETYPEARQLLSEDGQVGLRCTVGSPDKESLLCAPKWGDDGTIADIEGRNETFVGGDDWDRLAEFLGDPDGQIGTGPQVDGFVGTPIGEVDEERLAALLADPPEPTPALRALLDPLDVAQDALWSRISSDLRAAGYDDAATEAANCSGSLFDAQQDQTALAGLRILEMPGQGRRFGVYLPADARGRHEFVVGPYEDEDGGAR